MSDRDSRNLQQLERFATLTTPLDESGSYATGQICFSDIEKYDQFPVIMQYGFESVPVPGARCIVENRNGDVNQGIAVAFIDTRYRPRNMPAGAACVYDSGLNYVLLNPNGVVTVYGTGVVEVIAPVVNVQASMACNITAPMVTITGNVMVNGGITATGDMTAGNISLQSHRHGDVQNGNGETSSSLP